MIPTTNGSLPRKKLNIRGIKKHNHNIKEWCEENNAIWAHDGAHLNTSQKTMLEKINISPRKWTNILNNTSLLSLDELIDIKQLLGAKSFNELIIGASDKK